MLKIFLSLSLATLFCLSAVADEASVKEAIEEKLGNKVTSVTKSPYLGLYEVFAEGLIINTGQGLYTGQVFYTDEDVTALLVGPLIDTKTMKNVTAERMQKLTAINFSDLPLDLAVKQVHGNGKRVLATFEDPHCGYCKTLAKEIRSLEDVTIYTFLLPILSPDSLEKSEQIWCSADKAKAWQEWIIDGKAPTAKAANCDTGAIRKTIELGKKLAITGTPTIFFADGSRIPGAAPLAQIKIKLDQEPNNVEK